LTLINIFDKIQVDKRVT